MLSKNLGKAILVAISCVGWVTNHFVSTKFPNQSDISAAVGWVPMDSSLFWLQRLCCAVHLPSVLLQTYTVDSSGEMPLPSWYVPCVLFHPYADKLTWTNLDHGCFVSTAVWPRQWWPSTFCIPTNLWQLDFVLEWIPGRLAADLGIHWADRRARYLTCTCFPSPVT